MSRGSSRCKVARRQNHGLHAIALSLDSIATGTGAIA